MNIYVPIVVACIEAAIIGWLIARLKHDTSIAWSLGYEEGKYDGKNPSREPKDYRVVGSDTVIKHVLPSLEVARAVASGFLEEVQATSAHRYGDDPTQMYEELREGK